MQSSLCAQAAASDVDKRITDLEKQLEAVRAELAALKSASSQQAPATQAVASPAPATPNPLAGISSVLGGATITGLVDTYYGYNANHPAGGTASEPFQATNGQFSLNLIELALDRPPDKDVRLGYHVALGFGQAMNAVNATDPGGLGVAQYLKEGYLSYLVPVGKGLQIDAGKFVTEHGAEVIETNQNWNYSRSLLFTYAIPYYHFGLRAKYSFNDKYTLSGFLVNGWNSIVDNNTAKTGGISLGWNPTKKLSITQNYMAGPEQTRDNADWRHLSDTVVAYNVNSKLALQANFDYGREMKWLATGKPADWTGIAGYMKYAFNPRVAAAVRYEYFNDHDGWGTGKAQHMNEFTGTLERRIAGHLLSRLEYRHDGSNQDFFQRGSSTFVKGQNTVDGGLVFVLEPNESK